ncbi:MAG: response regulator [Desulfobacterales bacterium]|nr:response regulator [Desulfobacterales bacterium]
MPIITIFNGNFCKEDKIIKQILDSTKYKFIADNDIVERASKISKISIDKLKGAFSEKTSVFNKFTHEKERSIAYLKLALSEILSEDGLLIKGFCSHLIPKEITHVLKICLIADIKSRLSLSTKCDDINEKESLNVIQKHDKDCSAWTDTLFKVKDPWDTSLYDIVIPTDKTDESDIFEIIENNLRKEVIMPTDSSIKAAKDFVFAAKIEVELAKEGHNVGVTVRDGLVTLTINKHVLMLSRLEEELKSIVNKVQGVKSIETRVGKGYHQTDIYRKFDFEIPSKLLLVDDEREFIQTLSERLSMRDMGSAIAYDGESALNLIDDDEPDVMILDLKMPGIDGIEVLKRVKETRPKIEVIILTGHGSEVDKEVCMKLGAFAYLQKPVDINLLSQTLKDANEKIREKK